MGEVAVVHYPPQNLAVKGKHLVPKTRAWLGKLPLNSYELEVGYSVTVEREDGSTTISVEIDTLGLETYDGQPVELDEAGSREVYDLFEPLLIRLGQ